MKRRHAMPFGAQYLGEGRTRFRLWAPALDRLDLVLCPDGNEATRAMTRENGGWWECVTDAPPGTRYRFRLADGRQVPDPASRYNPDDVEGPSVVIDPAAYAWQDDAWRGRPWHEAVIYEAHVGCATPEGTFAALEARLDHLVALGATAIELMPLADFPGRRNWGYDGVLPYAPDGSYGAPDDLKRFVEAAHARGLMVFVDVVYNHFGPEGNYLSLYAPHFFTEHHHTPWGAAVNFDDRDSRTVREFFVHNALYWLEEFHVDGLRFDAVHAIVDDSPRHVLVELAERVRNGPGRERHVHLIVENDANRASLLARDDGGHPRWYDAQWNDDFHHVFHVLLTGERDGYYADYAQEPTRLLGRCLAEGYAYQGEPSVHRDGAKRGEPTGGLPPTAFVSFLQNHDQTGNRAAGERLLELAPRPALRAGVCAWLLAPQVPLIFMGEEFGTDTPFLYFCNFEGALADAVREGRRKEFSGFASFDASQADDLVPDPGAVETFERCKLPWERMREGEHGEWLTLYTRLLELRNEHIAPRLAHGNPARAGATVHGEGALAVRWMLGTDARLELRLNLSATDVTGLAPPSGNALCVEPPEAAARFAAGELPQQAAAVYLDTESAS